MIFKGIKSGDYESFCFDVDKETFIKIKGEEPNKFDKSYFNEGKYRLYMEDIFRTLMPNLKDGEEVEIDINIKNINSN